MEITVQYVSFGDVCIVDSHRDQRSVTLLVKEHIYLLIENNEIPAFLRALLVFQSNKNNVFTGAKTGQVCQHSLISLGVS